MKEHQHLCTFDGLKKFRLALNRFKMPAAVFWSRWGLIYPPSKEIVTVVGKAIYPIAIKG